MNLEYVKKKDYYVPNTTSCLKNKKANIGKYGRMREEYLRQHRRALFDRMVAKEEIIDHLVHIDKEAHRQVNLLIKQLAKEENVNEELKKQQPILWMQRMNNIKNRAEEIVLNELIYS